MKGEDATHLDKLGEVFLEHAGQLRPRGVVALLVAPRLAGVQHLGRDAGDLRRHLKPENLPDGKKKAPSRASTTAAAKQVISRQETQQATGRVSDGGALLAGRFVVRQPRNSWGKSVNQKQSPLKVICA